MEKISIMGAHGVNPRAIRGGTPETTASDIAGAIAMGKISEQAGWLAYIKVLGHDNLKSRLSRWVMIHEVLTRATRENWECGMGIIPKLSIVALEEQITDGICRTCKGTKKQLIENRYQDCRLCGGTGRKRWSKRAVARSLGIHYKTFSRVWENRYRWVIGLYDDMETELKNVDKGLG